MLAKFVNAGLMVRSGDASDPFYKFVLDPVAEELDVSRLVIDLRDGKIDQGELNDLVARWGELPEDFVRALLRAAAEYHLEISANYSAFASQMWPAQRPELVSIAVQS